MPAPAALRPRPRGVPPPSPFRVHPRSSAADAFPPLPFAFFLLPFPFPFRAHLRPSAAKKAAPNRLQTVDPVSAK
jgi:hypothetical protein